MKNKFKKMVEKILIKASEVSKSIWKNLKKYKIKIFAITVLLIFCYFGFLYYKYRSSSLPLIYILATHIICIPMICFTRYKKIKFTDINNENIVFLSDNEMQNKLFDLRFSLVNKIYIGFFSTLFSLFFLGGNLSKTLSQVPLPLFLFVFWTLIISFKIFFDFNLNYVEILENKLKYQNKFENNLTIGLIKTILTSFYTLFIIFLFGILLEQIKTNKEQKYPTFPSNIKMLSEKDKIKVEEYVNNLLEDAKF
ncbi:MAG: hypothetical protein ACRC0S_07210 [Fusobacteriaceae bacterium]